MRQGIESILSPKQQRRPLPFLLNLSFFYGYTYISPKKSPVFRRKMRFSGRDAMQNSYNSQQLATRWKFSERRSSNKTVLRSFEVVSPDVKLIFVPLNVIKRDLNQTLECKLSNIFSFSPHFTLFLHSYSSFVCDTVFSSIKSSQKINSIPKSAGILNYCLSIFAYGQGLFHRLKLCLL